MSLSQETIDYMNSLPKPDDQEGWRKRALAIFGPGFDINRLPPLTAEEMQLGDITQERG